MYTSIFDYRRIMGGRPLILNKDLDTLPVRPKAHDHISSELYHLMGVRINNKRIWLFRSGIEKETRRKKGDDGSKRRKPETKPDVHHSGGFCRTYDM